IPIGRELVKQSRAVRLWAQDRLELIPALLQQNSVAEHAGEMKDAGEPRIRVFPSFEQPFDVFSTRRVRLNDRNLHPLSAKLVEDGLAMLGNRRLPRREGQFAGPAPAQSSRNFE